jgi:hypothetical protein
MCFAVFQEEVIGERLGQVLKDIYVPDEILGRIRMFLLDDRRQQEALNKDQQERYGRQLAASYPPHAFGLPG